MLVSEFVKQSTHQLIMLSQRTFLLVQLVVHTLQGGIVFPIEVLEAMYLEAFDVKACIHYCCSNP